MGVDGGGDGGVVVVASVADGGDGTGAIVGEGGGDVGGIFEGVGGVEGGGHGKKEGWLGRGVVSIGVEGMLSLCGSGTTMLLVERLIVFSALCACLY